MHKCNRNLHGMRNFNVATGSHETFGWSQVQWVQASQSIGLASHAINLGRAELRGSGPKETSSSLISTILKRGKFT